MGNRVSTTVKRPRRMDFDGPSDKTTGPPIEQKPTKVFLPGEVPLPSECATTTLTRTITLASGVFAPGHLGELTQQVPFELVDAVLAETLTTQRRLRQLPSQVGVYFLLALALFPTLGNARVWDKLTAGLHQLAPHRPSEKALRDLRRRLGPAPMKALFEVLAGPLAQPRTPGRPLPVLDRRLRRLQFTQGP
jgi:hypothetical protein